MGHRLMATLNMMMIPDAVPADTGWRPRVTDQDGRELWIADLYRERRQDALEDAATAVERLRYERHHQLRL
jgi:hypothetical protein